MRPWQLFALVVLGGTLTGWGAAKLVGPSGNENTASPIGDRGPASDATSLSADSGGLRYAPLASAMGSVAVLAMSPLELPETAAEPADMVVGKSATADPVPPVTAFVLESFSEVEAPVPLPDSGPTPLPEARGQLASLSTLKE